MRSKEEITDLFTTYFSDKLSPSEIDQLVAKTMSSVQNRRMRTYASSEVPGVVTLTTAEAA